MGSGKGLSVTEQASNQIVTTLLQGEGIFAEWTAAVVVNQIASAVC